MTKRQAELLERIELAVAGMRAAVGRDDSADCIDWGLTVQIATADLSATVITDVTNRERYND